MEPKGQAPTSGEGKRQLGPCMRDDVSRVNFKQCHGSAIEAWEWPSDKYTSTAAGRMLVLFLPMVCARAGSNGDLYTSGFTATRAPFAKPKVAEYTHVANAVATSL